MILVIAQRKSLLVIAGIILFPLCVMVQHMPHDTGFAAPVAKLTPTESLAANPIKKNTFREYQTRASQRDAGQEVR